LYSNQAQYLFFLQPLQILISSKLWASKTTCNNSDVFPEQPKGKSYIQEPLLELNCRSLREPFEEVTIQSIVDATFENDPFTDPAL